MSEDVYSGLRDIQEHARQLSRSSSIDEQTCLGFFNELASAVHASAGLARGIERVTGCPVRVLEKWRETPSQDDEVTRSYARNIAEAPVASLLIL